MFTFDNNNAEYGRQLAQDRSYVSLLHNRSFRVANPHGMFSYLFSIPADTEEIILTLTFHSLDAGKQMILRVNDDPKTDKTITVEPYIKNGFFHHDYVLPKEWITNKDMIKLMFLAGEQQGGRLFGIGLYRTLPI
ncbi:hypothetical protein NIE88_02835 [Sporolactobacillus shoreicorticis]|uniref:Uncharacterized protein n=1 Tax=Sporolactobacillus shoreicorticis TaxID=1923877 RepID=A0ABW5S066_9BACL|nr:hypothetical protein [Sporolactobacillus shoreicorticis]MCO7124712.1 hypothetical protein [Sporolactobacillus shoreicorticis]